MLLIPDIRKHFELRLVSKQHVLLSQFDQVTEVCNFNRDTTCSRLPSPVGMWGGGGGGVSACECECEGVGGEPVSVRVWEVSL